MKCPYHLVQAAQMGCRHDAHAFESPGATAAPQHAHRMVLTGSAPAPSPAPTSEVVAFFIRFP